MYGNRVCAGFILLLLASCAQTPPRAPVDASQAEVDARKQQIIANFMARQPPTHLVAQDITYNSHYPPQFPLKAVAAGHYGVVTLLIYVDAKGKIGSVRVDKSSGYPELDASAIDAAKQWIYFPAAKDGVPQPAWVRTPVTFARQTPAPPSTDNLRVGITTESDASALLGLPTGAIRHADGLTQMTWGDESVGMMFLTFDANGKLLKLRRMSPTSRLHHDPLSPFTDTEMRKFMSAVAQADKIGNAMQRCLQYPDPPGSHWSPVGVDAYCGYRLQNIVDSNRVIKLARTGRAHEIDRKLVELMQNSGQLRPEDVLWRTIAEDCFNVTPKLRRALDEWKAEAPSSAFARTMSGYCYVSSAWAARGPKASGDTSDQRFAAMQALLKLARADLSKAVKLNPHLIAPYAAMIEEGMLDGNPGYINQATTKGFAIDPASFPIFDMLQVASEPRWEGSQQSAQILLKRAMELSKKNPLLLTIRAAVLTDIYDLRHCYCATAAERRPYLEAFNDVASTGILVTVAANALDNHQPDIAYIYYSEALRFYPADEGEQARQGRLVAKQQMSE